MVITWEKQNIASLQFVNWRLPHQHPINLFKIAFYKTTPTAFFSATVGVKKLSALNYQSTDHPHL
jgi:hypothetical protein